MMGWFPGLVAAGWGQSSICTLSLAIVHWYIHSFSSWRLSVAPWHMAFSTFSSHATLCLQGQQAVSLACSVRWRYTHTHTHTHIITGMTSFHILLARRKSQVLPKRTRRRLQDITPGVKIMGIFIMHRSLPINVGKDGPHEQLPRP